MSDDNDNSVDDEIVPHHGKKRKSDTLKTWKKNIEKGDNKEFEKEGKDKNTIKRTMTDFYKKYELSRISKSIRLQYKLKKIKKENNK